MEVVEGTVGLTNTLRMTSLVIVDWVFSLPQSRCHFSESSQSIRTEKEEVKIQPTWEKKPKLVSEGVLGQISYPVRWKESSL